ncbi:MAG: 4-hydroxythreonine-4-phosphate dehydrogenase PdxA [Flavobacteriales bacterium]|jgi:4-hydroxythreonine-4-phosphate dehydrogenase|nr:4-hydroxythreonine-4-phosphate dehydrogenase PdxA [Flavobacteriales bacterium]|tara:strand:- start:709 stop:1746 length:1038 start_codon:yes stop_codon:yes gene_type:complete
MSKIKVGISIGDLNGIGMEIIIKTFKDSRVMDFCTPIIFGSSKVAAIHRKTLEMQDFNFNIINDIKEAHPKKANLLNIWKQEVEIKFGEATTTSGEHAFDSLKQATQALKDKKIDVLVTAPINKASIQEKVSGFIGHTEFLQGNFDGESLMIMISEAMKIAFVTGHVPLTEVKKAITPENILAKTEKLNNSLIQDFGIRKPKIAILGLNPHAGEEGMLGNEENDIISPAIKKMKENGIMAFGPYPADSFFTPKNLKSFDGILSMYHDQGLTAFKTLSFSEGINYTAGLNIVRTSPVHGTAYEIAGKGLADETSFREALFLACQIHKKRSEFNELNDNPLAFKTRK